MAWKVASEVLEQLEAFTCAMYFQARETSVDMVKSLLLKKMVGEDNTLNSKSKVDMVCLPPFQDSLIPHMQWVNHHAEPYQEEELEIDDDHLLMDAEVDS